MYTYIHMYTYVYIYIFAIYILFGTILCMDYHVCCASGISSKLQHGDHHWTIDLAGWFPVHRLRWNDLVWEPVKATTDFTSHVDLRTICDFRQTMWPTKQICRTNQPTMLLNNGNATNQMALGQWRPRKTQISGSWRGWAWTWILLQTSAFWRVVKSANKRAIHNK